MLALESWYHERHSTAGANSGAGAKTGVLAAGNAYHRKIFRTLELHHRIAQLEGKLLIEPWLRSEKSSRLCQPDAVLLLPDGRGIVIEVKKNWRDGRDDKLLDLYLAAVRSAFGLSATFPLMICGCVRGLRHPAMTSLQDLVTAPLQWQPGDPTPVVLSL